MGSLTCLYSCTLKMSSIVTIIPIKKQDYNFFRLVAPLTVDHMLIYSFNIRKLKAVYKWQWIVSSRVVPRGGGTWNVANAIYCDDTIVYMLSHWWAHGRGMMVYSIIINIDMHDHNMTVTSQPTFKKILGYCRQTTQDKSRTSLPCHFNLDLVWTVWTDKLMMTYLFHY